MPHFNPQLFVVACSRTKSFLEWPLHESTLQAEQMDQQITRQLSSRHRKPRASPQELKSFSGNYGTTASTCT